MALSDNIRMAWIRAIDKTQMLGRPPSSQDVPSGSMVLMELSAI